MAEHPDDGVLFDFGRETLQVPPLPFYNVQKAWPAIERLRTTTNKVEETWACLEIVVAALDTGVGLAPTYESIARKLKAWMMDSFVAQTIKLLDVSGLLPKGEAAAGATA